MHVQSFGRCCNLNQVRKLRQIKNRIPVISGGSRGGGGGGQGGALSPLKKISTIFLLFVITINTVSLIFCPSVVKEIAQDLQDEDIINEFAAKLTALRFASVLVTMNSTCQH